MFEQLREKYPIFIYHSYHYELKEELEIEYHFEIPGLTSFYPKIRIPKKYIKTKLNKEYLEYLIGQIGLIELLSYVKCTCSKKIQIDALYIDEEQIRFFQKLYYKGLGELLYRNNIVVDEKDLFEIICTKEKTSLPTIEYQGEGNLICVGGGKDSCVSLEILKEEKNNSCFIINPKAPSLECSKIAGYEEESIIQITRILDHKIIELNKEGYLNGHTPLSAAIAFISYLCAYLSGKKNIIVSNESSANEETVLGTEINHQYSKTIEFENDFRKYSSKLNLGIEYFSLLRGLSEYNIARIFSHYPKYHNVFKSCNLGSKEKEWVWCCNCPKCLFIYIILSPFIEKEERIKIFGEDLYEREDLVDTFIELLGYSEKKPFECVGTYEEVRLAIEETIKNHESGYLLDYYKNHYKNNYNKKQIEEYKEEHNLTDYYNQLVKKELNKYV